MTASYWSVPLLDWRARFGSAAGLGKPSAYLEGNPSAARRAHQGIGGDECLFDRLLCVSDERRTASEENNAHTLALKRDKYEDMANSPRLGRQYSPAKFLCQ
jgi:hypothetical protein